jgi:hypothetical protein
MNICTYCPIGRLKNYPKSFRAKWTFVKSIPGLDVQVAASVAELAFRAVRQVEGAKRQPKDGIHI